MLARITRRWGKIAVLFVYVFTQILVLAALLLTNTSIIVHSIFLVLAVVLYFLTALKQPGFYTGPVEQNHEDAQLSTSKPRKAIKLQPTRDTQIKKELGDINIEGESNKKQVQQEYQVKVRSPISPQKQESALQSGKSAQKQRPASIEDIIQPKENYRRDSKNQFPGDEFRKNSSQKPRFKLFEVAKSMFQSFAVFKSEKKPTKQLSEKQKSEEQHSATQKQSKNQTPNKECLSLQKEKEAQSELKGSVIKEEKGESLKVHSPFQEDIVSSIVREKACNSAIGKEDFMLEHIQAQLQQDKIKIEPTHTKLKSIISKIQKIKRYCRICSAYQPLRVKHCHSCQKCIATFDHHCPWLSNCIGEKNKLFFLLYLIFQTLQLLTITIDLCRHLASDQPENPTSQGILLMAALLFFLTLTGLLVFHLYLFMINLTTWQFLKWNQIQYLSLFDRSKLSSPFTKGLWQNLKQLWSLTKSSSNKDWLQQMSQDLSQFIVRKSRSAKSQAHVIDSDRRPFRSQKAIL